MCSRNTTTCFGPICRPSSGCGLTYRWAIQDVWGVFWGCWWLGGVKRGGGFQLVWCDSDIQKKPHMTPGLDKTTNSFNNWTADLHLRNPQTPQPKKEVVEYRWTSRWAPIHATTPPNYANGGHARNPTSVQWKHCSIITLLSHRNKVLLHISRKTLTDTAIQDSIWLEFHEL